MQVGLLTWRACLLVCENKIRKTSVFDKRWYARAYLTSAQIRRCRRFPLSLNKHCVTTKIARKYLLIKTLNVLCVYLFIYSPSKSKARYKWKQTENARITRVNSWNSWQRNVQASCPVFLHFSILLIEYMIFAKSGLVWHENANLKSYFYYCLLCFIHETLGTKIYTK